jgi:hypothetical protein
MIANFKFAPRSALLFTLGPWACGVFAATARAAPASPPGPEKISYGVEAVLLVVLILSLLALLFWLLLRWSHRLDQASYLGDVYRESVEDFEYKRLATAPTERLRGGEYHREIEQDGEWLRKNERPEPPPGFYAGTAVGPPRRLASGRVSDAGNIHWYG